MDKEQFTMVPHSIMSNRNLTDQDKLTLSIILSFVNNDKQCYIGNDRLGDMLGISKNAASKRIQKLESLGCIKLDYTYKEGKKEVDKRYITLLSTTPKVCPDSRYVSPDSLYVSSDSRGGISYGDIGYGDTHDRVSSDSRGGVCPKVGGIKQPFLLDNLKENLEYNELHMVLHSLLDGKFETKEEIEEGIQQISNCLDLIKNDYNSFANEKRGELENKRYQLNTMLTQLEKKKKIEEQKW